FGYEVTKLERTRIMNVSLSGIPLGEWRDLTDDELIDLFKLIEHDALLHDHHAVLAKSTGGAVAVFANNAPAFYAVTPARMAELLA
ncbi:23S rRNA pseudouridine(2604) synthase RluF, partial [Salmonella enterica subsp. enterica serovar Kentucky]|nr:23S rRNA pseudouridine(2604) synthase RluF [Salmonella enterica subsp. enterica serovar Kentucky]